MNAVVRPANADQVMVRLGLKQGGKVQKFWTSTVQRRIKKFLPARDKMSVSRAVNAGTDLEHGRITVRGPHIRYLYYGKVMVGYPKKHAIDKDLKYTKDINRAAGPLWDRALVQNEMPVMERELDRYIKGGRP